MPSAVSALLGTLTSAPIDLPWKLPCLGLHHLRRPDAAYRIVGIQAVAQARCVFTYGCMPLLRVVAKSSNALPMSLMSARYNMHAHSASKDKPSIAQLAEHLTVEYCSNQMVPGSIPGRRIFQVSVTALGRELNDKTIPFGNAISLPRQGESTNQMKIAAATN